MRPLVALTALCAAAAHAAPVQLHHQARLLDAVGAPLSGPHSLSVGLYADGSTTTALWSETIAVDAADGYVSLILGADPDDNPLHDTVFDGSPRYLGLSLGATALGPRQLLATVPSAVHATNLSGGSVAVTGLLTLGDPAGSTCAVNGALRFNTASSSLQICDGAAWHTLYNTGKGRTSANPATSCKQIDELYNGEVQLAESGPYWIKPAGYSGAAFEVWCEMDTNGGGWTLVGKVIGATYNGDGGVLDGVDTARWINRQYLGSVNNLTLENALGPAYESVPFTDFMLVGLNDPNDKLGWRHSETFTSLHAVFSSATQRRASALLFGNHKTLDYRSGCEQASGPDSTGPQFYGFNINSDSNGGDSGTLVNGYGHGWCSALAGFGRDNSAEGYTGGGLGAYCYGRAHQMGRHYWGWGDGCNSAGWNSGNIINAQTFHGHAFYVR